MKYFHRLVLVCFVAPALGQGSQQDSSHPQPKEFVTHHQGTFGGRPIRFKAVAGEIYLTNKDGQAAASVWSTSYMLDGEASADRPVTFAFNGGPGSASVWLHLGLLGPRLVKVSNDGHDDGASPYTLINNTNGFLDLTDLVLVDPVGTGYSTVIGDTSPKDYWGLQEDARSIAMFVRHWLKKYKRWNSPKYLLGESFGTTRAVAVTKALDGAGQSVAINGLILISQGLDYTSAVPDHDNIVSFVNYLPSLAACAWYHRKAGVGESLEKFTREASDFALNEYVNLLFRGERISQQESDRAVDRLVYFTGLSKVYVEKAGLKISPYRYTKELLRDSQLTIGLLDGRFTVNEDDQLSDEPSLGDAYFSSVNSAYFTALNHYYTTELNVLMDRPYLTSNPEVAANWNWMSPPGNAYWDAKYVNVSRDLGNAMRTNKDLRVFVANGYYDLVTPFADAEYTFARHGILRDRISMTYYEAGHMMYVHEPSLIQLCKDIRAFYSKP